MAIVPISHDRAEQVRQSFAALSSWSYAIEDQNLQAQY